MQFSGLDAHAAREFAERWLPAWTGNQPEYLLSFYTDDAFYSDPAVPGGVQGKTALRSWFTKLLSRNPDWVWTHTGSIPIEAGFLNLWHAVIPTGRHIIEVDGVCTVQLRDGYIRSNRVFFDCSELLAAMQA